MKADILACYDDKWINKIIELATGSNVTHIAIQVTDTLCMEAQWYGVKLTRISDLKYYRLRCEELTKEQRREIAKFTMNKVDKKYDYKLLIGMAVKKFLGIKNKWDNPNKYICSEFAVKAFKSVGVDLLPYMNDYDVTPGDLMFSRKLKLIK